MHKRELDRLLEKTVADALGLALPPLVNSHHRAHGKPHRTYARKHVKPVLTVCHERAAAHA